MKTKKEIIEKVMDEIFQEDPYLDPNNGDLIKIIDMAYRKGYEQAINNYFKGKQ